MTEKKYSIFLDYLNTNYLNAKILTNYYSDIWIYLKSTCYQHFYMRQTFKKSLWGGCLNLAPQLTNGTQNQITHDWHMI